MPKLTKAVWHYRHQKMLALMDDLGVDALVFSTADFFQFATNFHTDVQPWERPIFAVIPREGEGFLVMNELSTNHMRFSMEAEKVWATDVTFYAEHPYSAEPGLYLYGVGGFRLDDTVVVGTTPRVLTETPKTLEYATVG